MNNFQDYFKQASSSVPRPTDKHPNPIFNPGGPYSNLSRLQQYKMMPTPGPNGQLAAPGMGMPQAHAQPPQVPQPNQYQQMLDLIQAQGISFPNAGAGGVGGSKIAAVNPLLTRKRKPRFAPPPASMPRPVGNPFMPQVGY